MGNSYKVRVSALIKSSSDLACVMDSKNVKAVKLTFEQAMAFDGKFSSFKEILTKFGTGSQLDFKESYDGYIGLYSPYGQAVARRDTLQIAKTIKSKILYGAAHGVPIELKRFELLILRTYFGQDFEKIFQIV